MLISTINDELKRNYPKISVILIQLFYDDYEKIYQEYKALDITTSVAI